MNDEHALKDDNVWNPSWRKGAEYNLPFIPVLKHSCDHALVSLVWLPSALASARGSSMYCSAVGGFTG